MGVLLMARFVALRRLFLAAIFVFVILLLPNENVQVQGNNGKHHE